MKETVMQFGEGGFLRGFVDYFFKKLNDAGVYEGKVVVIQPIDKGMVNMLNDQNCEYNLYLIMEDKGEIGGRLSLAVGPTIAPYTRFYQIIIY